MTVSPRTTTSPTSPGRERPVLVVDDRDFDSCSRDADGNHPRSSPASIAERQQRFRHRRDRARAFALAVSVPETRAEHLVSCLKVGGVDRRGAQKQGADVLDFRARESGMANETAETSRRRE